MTEQMPITDTIQVARMLRETCLDLAMAKSPRATHFGGSMSAVDIVSVLFFSRMRLDPSEPNWLNRDRFFLSKGHCVLSYYSALYLKGFLTREELFSYAEDATFLPGHPVINKAKGIEFTNGSLGMGLGVGVGTALALKKLEVGSRVFVLMGDGECNEGSVWESAMAASHFGLDNLTTIVDVNGHQQTGRSQDILDLGDLAAKFSSFGWHVVEIDGHDHTKLTYAFDYNSNGKPKAIIANTIKGKGFEFSEGVTSWHHSVLTKELYEQGKAKFRESKHD